MELGLCSPKHALSRQMVHQVGGSPKKAAQVPTVLLTVPRASRRQYVPWKWNTSSDQSEAMPQHRVGPTCCMSPNAPGITEPPCSRRGPGRPPRPPPGDPGQRMPPGVLCVPEPRFFPHLPPRLDARRLAAKALGSAVLSHTSKWHGERCCSSCLSSSGRGPEPGPAGRQQEGRSHPWLRVPSREADNASPDTPPRHGSPRLPSRLAWGVCWQIRQVTNFCGQMAPLWGAAREAGGRKGHLARTRSLPLQCFPNF